MTFFRYPGGKSKLRHQIQERFTGETSYCEPFFGGGSVGLHLLKENPQIDNVLLNDFDAGISAIWRSVKDSPQELCDEIMRVKPSVEAWRYSKEFLCSPCFSNASDTEIAIQKLIVHQMSFSGLGVKAGGPIGGKNQETAKYKVDCRWSPSHMVKRINAYHKLFKGKTIQFTSTDFAECLKWAESNAAYTYLDPPYYEKGNDLYAIGFSEADHKRLSDHLQTASYSWLLSYDDCPDVRALYPWARIESLDVNYTIKTSRSKGEVFVEGN